MLGRALGITGVFLGSSVELWEAVYYFWEAVRSSGNPWGIPGIPVVLLERARKLWEPWVAQELLSAQSCPKSGHREH